MSLGVAGLKPSSKRRETIEQKHDNFGLPNLLVDGLEAKKTGQPSHPLEFSAENWDSNREDMYYSMLRRTQGLHAPLRLHMEKHTARQMQRLPCLHSSNLMESVLTDRISTIDVQDVFNIPSEAEVIGQPHAMMERRLGLL